MPTVRSLTRLLRRAGRSVTTGPADVAGDRGVAAVEFALVAPLLFTLLFGIIAYGIYFCVWIAISEAAANGARASVAGLTNDERTSLANTAVTNDITSYGPLLTIANAKIVTQSVSSGGAFQVSVTYNMNALGLNMFAGFLMLPTTTPTATVTVSNGGL
jgi:Flp pilus assembly protein TadG